MATVFVVRCGDLPGYATDDERVAFVFDDENAASKRFFDDIGEGSYSSEHGHLVSRLDGPDDLVPDLRRDPQDALLAASQDGTSHPSTRSGASHDHAPQESPLEES
ncbi:hypothetical protein [Cellulomonas bogoriensis]|uniref:hypothetical protein n=1 Tax=Cellulomonas bogoriensis TaxID=301388 RepID=UPI000A7EA7F6|nr:hypothetical protein [Cellulomonas bogoriensis]